MDFEVTKASESELKETEKMLERIKGNNPKKVETCRYFLADRGYDSTKLTEWLETEGISFVIDIRNCWKGEESRQFGTTDLI